MSMNGAGCGSCMDVRSDWEGGGRGGPGLGFSLGLRVEGLRKLLRGVLKLREPIKSGSYRLETRPGCGEKETSYIVSKGMKAYPKPYN